MTSRVAEGLREPEGVGEGEGLGGAVDVGCGVALPSPGVPGDGLPSFPAAGEARWMTSRKRFSVASSIVCSVMTTVAPRAEAVGGGVGGTFTVAVAVPPGAGAAVLPKAKPRVRTTTKEAPRVARRTAGAPRGVGTRPPIGSAGRGRRPLQDEGGRQDEDDADDEKADPPPCLCLPRRLLRARTVARAEFPVDVPGEGE